MNARTVKRKGAPAKRRGGAGRPSLLSRAAAAMPISSATLDRLLNLTLMLLVGALAVVAASFLGLPAMAYTEAAEAAGRAGFEVKRVEVTGIDKMDRLTVYAIALDQHSMAMPLVDLEKVRAQLMTYGWIADARVSRRLPDTLLVDVVERKPVAVWQNNQELSLIDNEGVVLERIAANAMPDLPLLIGPDANRQTGPLATLIEAAPALRPTIAGASWVGHRRWDLSFRSGETLALPEGEEAAAKALVTFARMEGVERLLGRGFTRFDMRDPTRFVVRVPEGVRKAAAAEAAAKAAAAEGRAISPEDEKARREAETAALKGDA